MTPLIAGAVSLGCAVCSAAKDDASNFAFMVMTAFMTLLPLAVLGGLIFLVVRRVHSLEPDDTAARRAVPVQPDAAPASADRL